MLKIKGYIVFDTIIWILYTYVDIYLEFIGIYVFSMEGVASMYEHDYIKRLIESIGEMLGRNSAGQDAVERNINMDNQNVIISKDGLLEMMIRKYISDGKINEAEDKLMESIKLNKSQQNYKTALFFYNEIDKWDENKLARCSFSKQRIVEGLTNIKNMYNSQ
jgi:hypothetical protein